MGSVQCGYQETNETSRNPGNWTLVISSRQYDCWPIFFLVFLYLGFFHFCIFVLLYFDSKWDVESWELHSGHCCPTKWSLVHYFPVALIETAFGRATSATLRSYKNKCKLNLRPNKDSQVSFLKPFHGTPTEHACLMKKVNSDWIMAEVFCTIEHLTNGLM